MGVVFSDLENMVNRPLDKIRRLHWGYKIPLELTLLAIFVIWGSNMSDTPDGGCLTWYDERCKIYTWASLNGFFPERFMTTVASIAAILLALTSDVFAWILKTPPFQFLG